MPRNAADVIAYAFDADYYCTDCTEELHPGSTQWREPDFDPADFTDSEGNEIHAVFGSDEWWEPSEPERQVLACSRCGYEIDELEGDEDA